MAENDNKSNELNMNRLVVLRTIEEITQNGPKTHKEILNHPKIKENMSDRTTNRCLVLLTQIKYLIHEDKGYDVSEEGKRYLNDTGGLNEPNRILMDVYDNSKEEIKGVKVLGGIGLIFSFVLIFLSNPDMPRVYRDYFYLFFISYALGILAFAIYKVYENDLGKELERDLNSTEINLLIDDLHNSFKVLVEKEASLINEILEKRAMGSLNTFYILENIFLYSALASSLLFIVEINDFTIGATVYTILLLIFLRIFTKISGKQSFLRQKLDIIRITRYFHRFKVLLALIDLEDESSNPHPDINLLKNKIEDCNKSIPKVYFYTAIINSIICLILLGLLYLVPLTSPMVVFPFIIVIVLNLSDLLILMISDSEEMNPFSERSLYFKPHLLIKVISRAL